MIGDCALILAVEYETKDLRDVGLVLVARSRDAGNADRIPDVVHDLIQRAIERRACFTTGRSQGIPRGKQIAHNYGRFWIG
jgi:hypothetical protein